MPRKTTSVSVICPVCGAPFNTTPLRIQAGHGKYCSLPCKRSGGLLTTIEERFWKHVEKTDTCWLWTGTITPDGYGRTRGRLGDRRAHRFSWELHYGPIPDDQIVGHHCDTPRCIRPDHLFIGTPADNIADMVAKGRNNGPRGVTHHFAKLTENDVRRIRVLAAEGIRQYEIAKMFNVTRGAIKGIVYRRNWKHVE